MTIIEDRIKQLDTLTLAKGSHREFGQGHCFNEAAAWLAGEAHSDAPLCVSPVLRTFTISLNDQWDEVQRQKLIPFLPRVIGTAGDGKDEARSHLALDWLIRTYTPAFLDLVNLTEEAQALRDLRRIVDLASAEAAGPVVRAGRDKAYAARAAAGDAARDAARAAARAAAWAAARAAAGDAAWAAAWAAARAAARAAAGDALKPTVEALQASALDLFDRMIEGSS